MTEMRKCDNCKDHSGVIVGIAAHDRFIINFEKYMAEQTERTLKIYIGIILCLITGLMSICVPLANTVVKDAAKDRNRYHISSKEYNYNCNYKYEDSYGKYRVKYQER